MCSSAVFNLMRCFLKLCIICSALGHYCNTPMTPRRCDMLPKETNCSDSEIMKNIQITPVSNGDNNISSNGIFQLNFTMPSLHCCYKIHVLVNKSVTEDACENYIFTDSDEYNDKLLHTEINICFEHETYSGVSSCQRPISRKIDHVFTGCYALKYKSYTHKIVSKSKYITSNYNETEISMPISSCNYYISKNDSKNGDYQVEFQFTIEIPDDVRIWKFSVNTIGKRPRTCPFELKYNPEFRMYMDNISTFTKYCEIISHNTDKRAVDCTFNIDVPQNTSFFTILEFMDNRCRYGTLWKPTTCKWKFDNCGDPFVQPTTAVPKVETIRVKDYLSFCISISLVLVCTVLISAYYFRSRHNITTQYERTEANENNGTTDKNTDIMKMKNLHIIPENNDKSNGVVLLYVRSSSSFLKFMADFRSILKRYCHCDVYDFYDVNELDNVAKLGPFDWVNELRKTGCRIVWVDTPFSRSLVLSHSKDHSDKLLLYHDFRDEAFPVILNMTKHCIKDPKSLYENHFIIRFDALPVDDNTDDPFADISPHARYLMPRHFNQLCLDLSKQSSMMENGACKEIDKTSEMQNELQRLMNTLQNI